MVGKTFSFPAGMAQPGRCEIVSFTEGNISFLNFRYMDVSENSGTPKSSILIGFSIINHPFWGTPIFGNTHIVTFVSSQKSIGSLDLALSHSFSENHHGRVLFFVVDDVFFRF